MSYWNDLVWVGNTLLPRWLPLLLFLITIVVIVAGFGMLLARLIK